MLIVLGLYFLRSIIFVLQSDLEPSLVLYKTIIILHLCLILVDWFSGHKNALETYCGLHTASCICCIQNKTYMKYILLTNIRDGNK